MSREPWWRDAGDLATVLLVGGIGFFFACAGVALVVSVVAS